MGVHKKPIDGAQIFYLASIGCTDEEIAGAFFMTRETFSRRKGDKLTYQLKTPGDAQASPVMTHSIAEIIELGKGRGKMSLRRWQFKSAEGGNPTMLIWLGKNMLGQTDIIINAQVEDLSQNAEAARERLYSSIARVASSEQRKARTRKA